MKNKLHVAILDFDDIKNPLLSGGQATATFEVAKRLVKLGHKITVVCSRYPNSKDEENNGIFYKHIGLGSSNIKLNNAVFFFALPFAVMHLKTDVIIECFTAPISTCFSPLFTKTPVIGMPTMFEAEKFSKKYHLPFHLIERFGARFYKYFLAYSPINKSKMEKLNPKIISRIIPNGVSEEFFNIKTKEKNYGVFIGRIDIVQKGLDLLLDACRKIKKNRFKIIIAGNGAKSEEKMLKNLIKTYRLSSKVKFIGRVDGKQKIKLLANSLFGIYPSRFEDFPLVPLEYASLNKPLVCFDIPGLAWVPTTIALKIKPFETSILAQSIYTIGNDRMLRNRLKKHCRKFAKKYGWNEIAKKYAKFCKEVIKIDSKRSMVL